MNRVVVFFSTCIALACSVDAGGSGISFAPGVERPTTDDGETGAADGSSAEWDGGDTTDGTDATETSDPTGSGADTDASSDPGEDTTGAIGSGETTGASGTTGTTAPGAATTEGDPPQPPGQAYGPCDAGCAAGETCQGDGVHSWCAQSCYWSGACPSPVGGTASVACESAGAGNFFCALACTVSTQCPAGMECFAMGGSTSYCGWA